MRHNQSNDKSEVVLAVGVVAAVTIAVILTIRGL